MDNYRTALSPHWDPIHYVSKLKGKVYVHIGTHDLMIPSKRGYQLVNALKDQEKKRGDLKVEVTEYRFCDHSATAYRFSRRFGRVLDDVLK